MLQSSEADAAGPAPLGPTCARNASQGAPGRPAGRPLSAPVPAASSLAAAASAFGSLPGGSLTVSFSGAGSEARPPTAFPPAWAAASASAAVLSQKGNHLPSPAPPFPCAAFSAPPATTPVGVDGHRSALAPSAWSGSSAAGSARRVSGSWGATATTVAAPPPLPPRPRPARPPASPALPAPPPPRGRVTPPPCASPLGSWAERVWVYTAERGEGGAGGGGGGSSLGSPAPSHHSHQPLSPVAPSPAVGLSPPPPPTTATPPSAASTPPANSLAGAASSVPDAAWSRAFRRRWARVQTRAALQARGVVVASPPRRDGGAAGDGAAPVGGLATPSATPAPPRAPALDLLVSEGVWAALAGPDAPHNHHNHHRAGGVGGGEAPSIHVAPSLASLLAADGELP